MYLQMCSLLPERAKRCDACARTNKDHGCGGRGGQHEIRVASKHSHFVTNLGIGEEVRCNAIVLLTTGSVVYMMRSSVF